MNSMHPPRESTAAMGNISLRGEFSIGLILMSVGDGPDPSMSRPRGPKTSVIHVDAHPGGARRAGAGEARVGERGTEHGHGIAEHAERRVLGVEQVADD